MFPLQPVPAKVVLVEILYFQMSLLMEAVVAVLMEDKKMVTPVALAVEQDGVELVVLELLDIAVVMAVAKQALMEVVVAAAPVPLVRMEIPLMVEMVVREQHHQLLDQALQEQAAVAAMLMIIIQQVQAGLVGAVMEQVGLAHLSLATVIPTLALVAVQSMAMLMGLELVAPVS